MRPQSASFWTLPIMPILLLAGGCCHGLTQHTVDSCGTNRVYYAHQPHNLPDSPVPLVVVLHGATHDGCKAACMTRMNKKADEKGFIAVYPNGTIDDSIRTWDAGLCCKRAPGRVDDVRFIQTVIDDVPDALRHAVDSSRVFLAGFSNGAILAHRVARELPGRIAAIGMVGGTGNVDPMSASWPPVSVIAFHGSDDKRIEYDGGTFPEELGGQSYAGIERIVDFWSVHNQCATHLPAQPVDTIAEKTSHRDGRGNTEVVLYKILGGNHSWPGGRRVSLTGETPTQAISATDIMWEFFAQHPKP